MFKYYFHYFGPGYTDPAIYRINKRTSEVTYCLIQDEIMHTFLSSANSYLDIQLNPKDFIPLR